jgi:hypothetical protein
VAAWDTVPSRVYPVTRSKESCFFFFFFDIFTQEREGGFKLMTSALLGVIPAIELPLEDKRVASITLYTEISQNLLSN